MAIVFTDSIELEDYNVERLTRAITKAALVRSNGNRTAAAELLGVSIRTLRNWIKKYKLTSEVPAVFGKMPHRVKN